MPNDKLKVLTVKASQIAKAMERAEQYDRDWQAKCCEIARIPAIARRFATLNRPRFPNAHVEFHNPGKAVGLRWKDLAPESRDLVSSNREWARVYGWTFKYGLEGVCWNSVRDDYYGHNASCAWDGIRRETQYHEFLQVLYWLVTGWQQGVNSDSPYWDQVLIDAKIILVNDLQGGTA